VAQLRQYSHFVGSPRLPGKWLSSGGGSRLASARATGNSGILAAPTNPKPIFLNMLRREV